ncbi:MAG: glycerol-3-phosphate 1-O-acyltransferase PlsY [Anaerolineae bacterium]|nr:glycerol-3-phosphate 1-O-acyltransferase PlsY [Anaerolineae bacterium]
MTITQILIAALIGYLFGCIQTAYLLGKFVGRFDIRQMGSGNAGASNVTVIMGWKYGIITGILDILKGIVPVLIVKTLYLDTPALAYFAGQAAILGHIFPFYLNFRGGKGVATLVGMFLGYHWPFGLLLVGLMIVLPFTFDFIVVGSLTVFTVSAILTFVLELPWLCKLTALVLTVIAFIKHAENIQRIRNNEEVRMSDTFKKKPAD